MLSDTELIEWIAGIRAGREKAIEAFLRHFWPPVRRIVAKFQSACRGEENEWVELVLLHAMDQMVKEKLKYTDLASFHAWLFQLAKFRCIDLWRRHRSLAARRVETLHLKTDDNPASKDPSPPMVLERNEIRRILSDAIEKIRKPHWKVTLRLAWVEGYSLSEIAWHLGRPLNTIRTWERRGKQALREIIEREYPHMVEEFEED
jgi:RNA polymerase sigma factor (sigma-70 family)